jgi:nucleotide-binding universal stress UspA family protein
VAGTRRARCGSTTRAVMHGYQKTVVVLQRGAALGRPVVVVFDGSPSSERALVVGARLASEDHKNIVAAIVSAEAQRTQVLEKRVAEILEPLGLCAGCFEMERPDLQALQTAIRTTGCRTLVLGAEADVLAAAGAEALLEVIDCPVVFVR